MIKRAGIVVIMRKRVRFSLDRSCVRLMGEVVVFVKYAQM